MVQERIESGLSQADMARWAAVAALLLTGVGGFYYFADQALLYRVLGLVALFAAAAAVAVGSAHGQRFVGFMREARTEVRKMVWATRAETLQTSLVVFAAVIVMALFLWLLDRLLAWGVSLLLG
ncbi:MAG: preprotein translocase subunit SecE [Gammaproteobacteria bacterium]|nr:preprotein translocase subunit SecE [Gammaproteobacteria bacterium]